MRGSVLRSLTLSGIAFLLAAPGAHAFILSYGSGSGTDDHARYIAELVTAFRKDHPEAEVELRGSNSYIKPIIETLNSQFGEETPDLGVVDLVAWPILHNKKLLRPLTSVLSEKDLKNIRGGLRSDLTIQVYGRGVPDQDYALPFNRSFPLLYVNLERVPAMRDRLVVSWDELGSILSSVPKSQGTSAYVAVPLEDWIGEYIMANARGKTTLAGKTANFMSPAVAAVLKKLNTLVKLEHVRPVDSQKVGFRELLDGQAAMALLSMSNYRSVVSRATFPVQVSMPPHSGSTALQVGGGDLVMPFNPKRNLDEKSRKDIRSFILWFYSEKGAAVWAKLTGYLPVTRKGVSHAVYAAELKARPTDARVFRNEAKWKIHSFYALDDYCNIMQLRKFVRSAFKDAITQPDPGLVLKQADSFANEILARGCP